MVAVGYTAVGTSTNWIVAISKPFGDAIQCSSIIPEDDHHLFAASQTMRSVGTHGPIISVDYHNSRILGIRLE